MKKYISLTVDVENPQTPLIQKKFSDNRIWSNGWGISKIIETFNQFGITGSFFTNVYEYKYWGLSEIERILDFIQNNNQEVELHTHPIWVDEKRRENMFQLPYEEQFNIINSASDFIQSRTGRRPECHRAGAYGFNRDTLKAVKNAGLICDSSNFYGHKFCKDVVTKNELTVFDGILEAPVTYIEHQGRYLKTDIDWLDEHTIFNFCKYIQHHDKLNFVNIFMHSYSLTKSNTDWLTYEPDKAKLERLQSLLAAIKSLRGFEIVPLSQIARDYLNIKPEEPKKKKNSDKWEGAFIPNQNPQPVFNTERKEIIFVKRNPHLRVYKEAWALKKKYPEFRLILMANQYNPGLFEGLFDEILIYDTFNDLIQYVTQNTPMLYHVHAEPNAEAAIVKEHSSVPVIYDVSDFAGLRFGIDSLEDEERKFEKYALENCDAIIFKYPEYILDYFRNHGYKIEAPVLRYMDYCIEDNCVLGTPNDNNIQLAYWGNLSPASMSQEKHGNYQYSHIAKKITDQGLYYNLFANSEVSENSLYSSYFALQKENNAFNFQTDFALQDIHKAIKDMHFGVSFHDYRGTQYHPLYEQTSIGNTLSTYLEAGLPVIVSSNLEVNTQVVEELGIGFGITLDDLNDLANIIKNTNYNQLKQKVVEVRENEMSATENVSRLMSFYKSLV